MSGILRRTAFMERTGNNEKGYFRPFDWALCTTGLGTMVEPFIINQRYGLGDATAGAITTGHDFEDEISMINEISFVDSDKQYQILGNEVVIGGALIPRIGR